MGMTETIIIGLILAVCLFGLIACYGWNRCARDLKAMRSERNACLRSVETLAARLRDVEPREARFRKALAYYADSATWAADMGGKSPAFRDRGRVAAVALGESA